MRLKKILMRCAWVVGSLLALILVGLVVIAGLLQTDWGRNQVRLQVQDLANATLRGELSIGSIEGNLLAGFSLHNVALRDPQGQLVLTSPMIAVDYHLAPVLAGEVRISSLLIEQPTLYLEEHAEGWNLMEVLPLPDDKKSTLKLSIEKLELKDGLITIQRKDQQEESREELRDVQLVAELWIDGESRKGAVHSSSLVSSRWPNAIELSADFQDSPLLTTVDEARLQSGKSSVSLEKLVLSKLETSALESPKRRGALRVDLRAKDLQRLTAISDWRADLLAQIEVTQADATSAIVVQGQASAASSSLAIAAEVWPQQEKATMKLDLREIDPQSLAPSLMKAHVAATLNAEVQDWSQWKQGGRGTVSATGEGTLQGRPIDELKLSAKLEAGIVSSEVVLKAPGTDVEASAALDVRDVVLVKSSHLIAKLDLQDLAKLVPVEGAIAGHVKLEAHAEGPLDALRTHGSGEARSLRYLKWRAARLDLSWQLALGTLVPKGEVAVDLRAIRVGLERVGRVKLTVDSKNAKWFDAKLAVSGFRQSAARFSARVLRNEQGLEVQLPQMWLRVRNLIWKGQLSSLYLADSGAIDLRDLRLHSKAGRVEASARWRSKAETVPSEARVRLQELNVGLLSKTLAGVVDTDLGATGSASVSLDIAANKPMRLAAEVNKLSSPGKIGALDASVELVFASRRAGQWSFVADAGLGGKVHGQGTLALKRNWRDARAWQGLNLSSIQDASIEVEDLSVSGMGYQLDQDLRGTIDGSFQAHNGFRQAKMDLRSEDLHVPNWTKNPVDANVQLVFEDGRLHSDSRIAMEEAGSLQALVDIEVGRHPLYELGERIRMDQINRIELRAEKLDLGRIAEPFPEWRDVRGVVAGEAVLNPRADTVELSVRASELALGRFAAGVWRLNLDIQSDSNGAELKVEASPDKKEFFVANVHLPVAMHALVAGDQRWKSKPMRGQLKIPSVSLRRVRLFAEEVQAEPAAPVFDGHLRADFKIAGSFTRPSLNGHASARDLVYLDVPLPSLDIKAQASETDGRVELKLVEPSGQGTLAADLRGNWETKNVDATLQAKDFGLAFLNPILLQARIPVASLSGSLQGQGKLQVRGTKRQLSGAFKLNKGRISLPQPLDSLHEIEATIDLDSDGLTAKIDGHSSRGRVQADAKLSFVDLKPDHLQLDIESKDMPLSIQGADVVASLKAGLRGELKDDRWVVRAKLNGGEVYLPRLPKTESLHPIGELEDVVFVSELEKQNPERQVETRGWELGITTDKAVRIHGDDLDVDLKIDLQVTKMKELVVEGTVRTTKGEVTILDRKYRVEEARVTLSKNEPRPMLYVRISRQFPQAAVIVTVSGYPDELDLELMARPSIYSHEEILSLIVNGVPSAGGGNRDQAVLSAVAGLATQQITARLREPLGVDSLAVGTEDGGKVSSVQVGKWITDAIFVAYYRSFVADPTKNQDEARMEWWLSGDWLLEVRAGDAGAGSADLLWIFRY